MHTSPNEFSRHACGGSGVILRVWDTGNGVDKEVDPCPGHAMKGEPRGKLWFLTDNKAPCGLYLYFWVHLCSGSETKQEAACCHARHWPDVILNLEDSKYSAAWVYAPLKLCVSGQAALTKSRRLMNSRHFFLTVLKTRSPRSEGQHSQVWVKAFFPVADC